MKQTYNTFL